MQDLPPRSNVGLTLAQPAIYYGLSTSRPVIVPNKSHELDYPLAQADQEVDYQGKGGVKISGLFRKLVFALHYKQKNIFFNDDINANSRILIRRNIVERIKKITPFLLLDDDPCIVVTPQRTYWVQDAYTYSNRYPNVQPYTTEVADAPEKQVNTDASSQQPLQANKREKFNYIRNSVKIVVDAYDGTVDY